jgi:hypothetical protein
MLEAMERQKSVDKLEGWLDFLNPATFKYK